MRVLGIVCAVSLASAATPDQIRSAAAKGLALIQSSQNGWYTKQSCTSCHQQYLPAMAIAEAREHGIPVDEAAARADAAKTFGLLGDFDRAVQYWYVIDPALDDAQRLLAAHAAGVQPSIVTATYARLLASYQYPDGHWTTGDVRPPQAYSNVTATTGSMRVIQLYAHPKMAADTKARVEKARAWLAAVEPRDTQEKIDQLMGLFWAAADVKKFAADLKAKQRSDGGWASRDGLTSDAYSTAHALVALNDTGTATSDLAWQKGIAYLLSTQTQDGSWHVTSRLKGPAPVSPPYFETGYPYGHDQFISTMAASWAVAALARALGPTQKKDPLGDVKATAPAWAETMLFGSPAEVRAMVDKKFDVNSATAGGTTALMCAIPDLEKAKILMDHGAKVNARSNARYSALMVASVFPGSGATVRYLLSKGAEVKLPKGAGAPRFNASPLMLASVARNADVIRDLKTAGDDIAAKMNVIGMFPSTPLLQVINMGDTATIRALLDAGATVDDIDPDGLTPLAWTAIGNRTDAARLLIEHGANVNHVDKKGMTPLLYAASIDFGDSSMVDLLLKSGANAKAKSPDGLTAAELAKKYGHGWLMRSVGATSE
jgi:ankyrin repeat protein